MGKENVWIYALLVAVLLVSGATLFVPRGSPDVDLSGIESKLITLGQQTSVNTVAIASLGQTDSGTETSVQVSPGAYTLTQVEFEDQAVEVEALRLATESVNSKDFKKAALVALEDFNVTGVESYRDITLKVLDVDADGDEVTFDIKVLYFLDGDADETESARLTEFVVTVDDLDFDEEFADAEVDEAYLDDLEVLRVYN